MTKPFRALRAEMVRAEIDQAYACEQRGCGQTYMTERMTAKRPWTLDDMYWWMDTLDLPHDQLHVYFPPHGKTIIDSTFKVCKLKNKKEVCSK